MGLAAAAVTMSAGVCATERRGRLRPAWGVDWTDDSEHGKSGWVTDPEGNKVEPWQPPAGNERLRRVTAQRRAIH